MDYQNALDFVHSFYQQTWNNMLWLLGISFGLIGIIMPLFIQWFQTRSNKKNADKQSKAISDLFNSKMSDMYKKHDEMQKNIYILQAGIFITQGNLFQKTEIGNDAATKIIHSFLNAVFCYLNADYDVGTNIVIKQLITIITSQNFPQKIKPESEGFDAREIYNITITLFEKRNENGKYTTIISLLKEKIKFEG
jgi:hypothetical protein